MSAEKQPDENKSRKTVIPDEQKIRLAVKKFAGCFLRCGTEKNDVVSRIFMGTVKNDSKEVVASPVFTASGPVGYPEKCRRGFLYSERFRCGCVVIRHSVIPEFWKNRSNQCMEIELLLISL